MEIPNQVCQTWVIIIINHHHHIRLFKVVKCNHTHSSSPVNTWVPSYSKTFSLGLVLAKLHLTHCLLTLLVKYRTNDNWKLSAKVTEIWTNCALCVCYFNKVYFLGYNVIFRLFCFSQMIVIKCEVAQLIRSAYINLTPDGRTDGHTYDGIIRPCYAWCGYKWNPNPLSVI